MGAAFYIVLGELLMWQAARILVVLFIYLFLFLVGNLVVKVGKREKWMCYGWVFYLTCQRTKNTKHFTMNGSNRRMKFEVLVAHVEFRSCEWSIIHCFVKRRRSIRFINFGHVCIMWNHWDDWTKLRLTYKCHWVWNTTTYSTHGSIGVVDDIAHKRMQLLTHFCYGKITSPSIYHL